MAGLFGKKNGSGAKSSGGTAGVGGGGNGAGGIDFEGRETDSGDAGRKLAEVRRERAERSRRIITDNKAAGIGFDGKEMNSSEPGRRMEAERAEDHAEMRSSDEAAKMQGRVYAKTGSVGRGGVGGRPLRSGEQDIDSDAENSGGDKGMRREARSLTTIDNFRRASNNVSADKGPRAAAQAAMHATGNHHRKIGNLNSKIRKINEKASPFARLRAFLDRNTASSLATLGGIPLAFAIILIRAIASIKGVQSIPILGSLRYTETSWRKAVTPNFERLVPFTLTPTMAWGIILMLIIIFFLVFATFLLLMLLPVLIMNGILSDPLGSLGTLLDFF